MHGVSLRRTKHVLTYDFSCMSWFRLAFFVERFLDQRVFKRFVALLDAALLEIDRYHGPSATGSMLLINQSQRGSPYPLFLEFMKRTGMKKKS